jgi:hypothetical protein
MAQHKLELPIAWKQVSAEKFAQKGLREGT